MAVDLKVPEMGESVSEVYIGQWQKKEGDRVEQDDALVEIESEKATLDLRAPAAGVLTKILKASGDAAEVGEVIGRIDEVGAQDGSTKGAQPQTAKEPTQKTDEGRNESAKESEVVSDSPDKVREEPLTKRETSPREEEPKAATKSNGESVPKSAPATASVKSDKAAPPQAMAASDKAAKKSSAAREEERVAMSPIRRRIATRLVEAQSNAALLTTFNEVDMSAVKHLRSLHGESFERRHHVRLGFMSFFVKAAVEALRQFPELNAIIDENEIVYRRYYDIGVAISSDKGLVVPILRDADHMSFANIEQSIEDLSKRARSGELKVEELQGGTFTITNGGVFGSLLSTPIVNPPQSGVLGMHAIQNRPVAAGDQVVIRPMMYIALTYDHRIVDGREAVTFLKRIKEIIEEPARLLLEA